MGSLPSSEGIRETVKNKTVSDTDRGPRRRLAGLIGADPRCKVRRALSHKSVVRQGTAAAEPLGLEGVSSGFMPEVSVWAEGQGNRRRAPDAPAPRTPSPPAP